MFRRATRWSPDRRRDRRSAASWCRAADRRSRCRVSLSADRGCRRPVSYRPVRERGSSTLRPRQRHRVSCRCDRTTAVKTGKIGRRGATPVRRWERRKVGGRERATGCRSRLDVVRDRTRFAPQGQIPEIERLGHEDISSHEQELARLDISGVGVGGHDELAISRIQ